MSASSATKILLLEFGAHAAGSRHTREFKAIRQALGTTKHGSGFKIDHEYAIAAIEIPDLVMRHEPAVVHFSGHGNEEGELIYSEREGVIESMDAHAIAKVFGLLSKSVGCVVLNACYSESQAELMADHIDVVIGIRGVIEDNAAMTFSVAFYGALGHGKSVGAAYEIARQQISLAGLPDGASPRLFKRQGVDPAAIFLHDRGQQPVVVRSEIDISTGQAPERRRPLRTMFGLVLIGAAMWVWYDGSVLPVDLATLQPFDLPAPQPVDAKRECRQGNANACKKIGNQYAQAGEGREANYYLQEACSRGDQESCGILVPSAASVCDRVMGLLERVPSPGSSSLQSVARAAHDECVAAMIEQAGQRGRVEYQVYAGCVLDSHDSEQLARCRKIYDRTPSTSSRARTQPRLGASAKSD